MSGSKRSSKEKPLIKRVEDRPPGLISRRPGKPTLPDHPWVDGFVDTPLGPVPRIMARLSMSDRLGRWKARWGVGRMHYLVPPGLYALGNPGEASPVLVTASYKMSFDALRSGAGGTDAWILVLDTRGINVWCAAGKGTFGTGELVSRIGMTGLAEVVVHRRLILPQLGAPGVSAHAVRRECGFTVRYGPVRAEDIPAYLAAGMRATDEMRRVTFPFRDRLVLVPVELVQAAQYALPAAAALFLLAGFHRGGYSISKALEAGLPGVALLTAAVLTGAVATPLLLPWLPGRAFSVKGALAGGVIAAGWVIFAARNPGAAVNLPTAAAWVAIIPAVASFLALNFTGSSTYTSLSGVRREMRAAVPIQIAAAAVGLGSWLVGRFI